MKTIFSVALIVLLWSCGSNRQGKFAYINNQQVYAEFHMTKDLLTEYNAIFENKKKGLDSMEVKISGLIKKVEMDGEKNKTDLGTLAMYKEEFFTRKRQLEEENEILNQKYQQQILDRLNQYLKDFGKEKELTILFGANGGGEIMYADSTIDMTEEAIAFINNKYKGVQ
jgi:outer membrane protein